MEHVTIKSLSDNKVLLTPDKGYRIADYNGNLYSVVVCAESDINTFRVSEI